MESKIHQEILEDICGGCHNYCLLKEIMVHKLSLNDRALEQMKCVEKFKFEQSEKEKKDIGWTEAWKSWVNEGYAKKFSEVYKPGMVHGKIWESIFNPEKETVLDSCIYFS